MSSLKGWLGEILASLSHWLFLDRKTYFAFRDVTLPALNGTTQIDQLIISRFGIFVIEIKNIDGWIFGTERDAQWTVSKFGRKNQFQNPLRQNYRHLKAVAEFLRVGEEDLHSIVMFWGDCSFKTPMPPNVLSTGYTGYIKGFSKIHFSDERVQEMSAAIRAGMLPRTRATKRAHLESLQMRYSSTTVCPKCGKALVRRTGRNGPFYGCSGYPKCRHTKAIEG